MNKDKKIKEVKNEMENLKKDFDKNYLSLETKLKKLEKGTYEVGDDVNWCNFDWIVIKTIENEQKVVLMSKEVFEPITYSDNNSNDYSKSNVEEYLEECFINKLDKSKLVKMRTNYDEDKYVDSLVRIPTLREIEPLSIDQRECGKTYWTMTSNYASSADCAYASVFVVNTSGNLYGNYSVCNKFGVRPVIMLNAETLIGLQNL